MTRLSAFYFALAMSFVEMNVIAKEPAASRPNILWISTEDISPDLGCYGDANAITPTIDRLAAEGVRFTRCFTHAGVCAPSRSGLITGCYPTSIGTHHMRCKGVPPDDVRCFPEYLRQAGYYCTNNVKTDYQFDVPDTAWDANSNKADWRGRKENQPFFCVINFTTTHESQIRNPGNETRKLVEKLSPDQRHSPEKMIVPPFYPDTPIVRNDLANYYDNITAMDGQVAAVLKRLEEDGLSDDTIVWFWGDHGRGMPRYKRWIYDTGTRVPLIVRVPAKWRAHVRPDNPESLKPGSSIDDLTAFVDFAPTLLSLANVPPLQHMQGQAFFGPHRAATPREFVYGHRDRMDETYDLIRTVRDRRFRYVRNFMPWQPYSQDISYMNEMPTMKEWRRLHSEGKLSGAAENWFRNAKPAEELYDTEADPYEINNLAGDPRYQETIHKLSEELRSWMIRIDDVGLIPESILDELQRPGAIVDQTAMPGIEALREEPNGDIIRFRVKSHTPGASIAYRILQGESDKKAIFIQWMVAPADGVIAIKSNERIEAKACRIGFQDSPIIRQGASRKDFDPAPNLARPHWKLAKKRESLSNLYTIAIANPEQLAAMRSPNVESCLKRDSNPGIQWWIANHYGRSLVTKPDPHPVACLKELLRQDSSPASRIIAARWLCEVEDTTPYLKLLSEYLSHPQKSVQLEAITALSELGEKARPVLESIRKAYDNSEYVGRISQRIRLKLISN